MTTRLRILAAFAILASGPLLRAEDPSKPHRAVIVNASEHQRELVPAPGKGPLVAVVVKAGGTRKTTAHPVGSAKAIKVPPLARVELQFQDPGISQHRWVTLSPSSPWSKDEAQIYLQDSKEGLSVTSLNKRACRPTGERRLTIPAPAAEPSCSIL